MIVLFHNEHGATRHGEELERFELQHECKTVKVNGTVTGTFTRMPGSLVAILPSHRVVYVEEMEIYERTEVLAEAVRLEQEHHDGPCGRCRMAERVLFGPHLGKTGRAP